MSVNAFTVAVASLVTALCASRAARASAGPPVALAVSFAAMLALQLLLSRAA